MFNLTRSIDSQTTTEDFFTDIDGWGSTGYYTNDYSSCGQIPYYPEVFFINHPGDDGNTGGAVICYFTYLNPSAKSCLFHREL